MIQRTKSLFTLLFGMNSHPPCKVPAWKMIFSKLNENTKNSFTIYLKKIRVEFLEENFAKNLPYLESQNFCYTNKIVSISFTLGCKILTKFLNNRTKIVHFKLMAESYICDMSEVPWQLSMQ